MKIILAPDSFKESLTAEQVCNAMKRGILAVAPDTTVISIPLADGGEGTVRTLSAGGGQLLTARVSGPLGQEVTAEYGLLRDGETAVIEMAAASGLPLVPLNKRNPLNTTTYGTGQLIRRALDQGARRLLIGIGGSATNDGGAGMAQALGVKFFDGNEEIHDFMTGALLGRVSRIDFSGLDSRIKTTDVRVACDVDNPLLGARGAARIYAPQKGADAETVDLLEKYMRHFYDLVEAATTPVRDVPGAGAAGGLGAGLVAFVNAKLLSGIDAVLDACDFDRRIQQADLILTGEGKIDLQSAMGKTISGLLKRAEKASIPVIAIGGAILDGAERLYDLGLLSMFSICDRPMTLDQAIDDADRLIEKAAQNIMRLLQMTGCPPINKT